MSLWAVRGEQVLGQASLGPALASLVPVLFLSTSIKQLKHSLLCKQSLVGFMELQGTMCLSPGPSQPTLQLEMQFSLSFGACPCSLYSCLCLCLHPGAADPASPSPVPRQGDSSGCHRHPAQGWGQLYTHRGDAGSDPDSLEVQTPAQLCPSPGDMWDMFAFHVHLLSKPSIPLLFPHSSFSCRGTFHHLSKQIAHWSVWRGQDQTSSDISIK